MISFEKYQKYENLQSKYLRTLDLGYIDMEYWLEYAKTAKPLAIYRSKADMRNHTAKMKKAYRITRDYQAWVKKIEKAESKNPKAGIGRYSGMYKVSQRRNQMRAEGMEKERQKSLMWDSPKTAKVQKPKSTKPKEAKTMARGRKSTKKTYTKDRIKAILKRANKNFKRVHKKGKGKAVNTRFGYTASTGVYVYYLKERKKR